MNDAPSLFIITYTNQLPFFKLRSFEDFLINVFQTSNKIGVKVIKQFIVCSGDKRFPHS
jgi:hypothetical protein